MMEDLIRRPLPAEKRLLLYLLPYRAGSDLYEAPQEVGQDAISRGIGIRKDNLPRVLKKLKEEGIVEERTMHMKGYSRRRKAYFLTEKGRYLAEDLYHRILSLPITLRLEGGGVRRENLKDLMVDYSLPRKEILSVLNMIWEGRGILNEVELKETAEGSLPETTAFIDEAPIPKVFYGREGELRALSEWCEEEPSGFYVITGIAGIGKTTLAAEFIRRQRGYYNIFWKKIRRWDSLKSILSSLSLFLQSLGRPRLKSLIMGEKGIHMGEAIQILKDDLNGSDSILVFDDFQRASDELLNFFSSLKEALEETAGVKIILVGRHVIPIYDRREVILEKYVREMVLEGLDEESSKKLLGEKVKDEETFQRIYAVTKGHPLFLKIISTTREPVGEIDIKRYIYEEIFRNLTQEEIDLLSVASIYRLPVSSGAFFIKEDIDFKTIDNLVEKNLLQEISYDTYDVHDIIKEFFYRRLSPIRRRQFHRAAAQYYLEQGKKGLLVEAAYHYLRANEVYKALKILLTHGEDLISLGMTDEFYSTLLKINEKDVPEELKANYFYLKGRAEVISGRWDAALKTLKSALKTAEDVGDDLVAADSARLLGYILIRRGERLEALSHFKRALKEASSMEDRRRRALALIDLGELHSIFGDFPKAEGYLKKSISLIRDSQDNDLLAKAYVSLGILYTNWERYSDAIKMFNQALLHLKRTDNPFEYGRLKSNLGILYTKLGKYSPALKNFEEAIKAYEDSGEVRQLGYALAGSGEASLKIGDYKTAEGRLLEGLSIFRKLGERLKIATTSFTLGELYLKLGDLPAAKEYFEECWATLNRMQNPPYLKHYEKKVKEHLSKLKGKNL